MRKKKKTLISRKMTLIMMIILLCFYFISIMPKPVYASPKSLYVITNIGAVGGVYNPISAYEIRSTYLVHQTNQYIPFHGDGAVSLAIDSQSKTLFVTYESSNVIQLANATTFADLGTTTVPSASNLAGIVYDHNKGLLYTVDRKTDDLYICQWKPATHLLTVETHVNLTHSSDAYGIALDEINNVLYVADRDFHEFDWYDTDTWEHLGTKTTTHDVIGIAVDDKNKLVYTTGWYDYGLYKYNITTDIETAVLNDTKRKYASVLGVAVDTDSSLIYVTTYEGSIGYSDVLVVFDSNLNELWRSGDIGNPTGIAVPRGEVSYISSGSSGIEYLLVAILGLVGCFVAFRAYMSKRKKRYTQQTELSLSVFGKCAFPKCCTHIHLTFLKHFS